MGNKKKLPTTMKFFNLALIASAATALRLREAGSTGDMPATHDDTMHQCWEEEEKREVWHPTDHNADMQLQRSEFEGLLWVMVSDWGMPMEEMEGALEWFDKDMDGHVMRGDAHGALMMHLQ